jgi:hypothetical protein
MTQDIFEKDKLVMDGRIYDPDYMTKNTQLGNKRLSFGRPCENSRRIRENYQLKKRKYWICLHESEGIAERQRDLGPTPRRMH